MHAQPRSAIVASMTTLLLSSAVLVASATLAHTASAAEAATCNDKNRGNVCESITWCAGAEGNKYCSTSYYWYPV